MCPVTTLISRHLKYYIFPNDMIYQVKLYTQNSKLMLHISHINYLSSQPEVTAFKLVCLFGISYKFGGDVEISTDDRERIDW